MSNAVIQQLPLPRPGAPRYPDDVDLRSVIRQGDDMVTPIRYSNDTWSLAGCTDMGARHANITFGHISEPLKSIAKDFVLLYGDPSLALEWGHDEEAAERWMAEHTKLNWQTARGKFQQVSSTLQTMHVLGLITLERQDWKTLAHEMRTGENINPRTGQATTMGPQACHYASMTLRAMDRLGPLMGRPNPFGTTPWGEEELRTIWNIREKTAADNRNKTNPVGDVFGWAGACLNFVNTCADDIIARMQWWTALGVNGRVPEPPPRYASTTSRTDNIGMRLEDWTAMVGAWAELGLGDLPGRPSHRDPDKVVVAHEVIQLVVGGYSESRFINEANVAAACELHGVQIVPANRATDFYEFATGEPRPDWLGSDDHLQPTSYIDTNGGLGWWADRLVYACYYVLAAVTTLREREMDALEADPIKPRNDSGWMMRGRRVKGQRIGPDTPVASWPVNDIAVRMVRTVQRLREAKEVLPETHDRLGHEVLFSSALLTRANGKRKGSQLSKPISKQNFQTRFTEPLTRLANQSVGCPVDGLQPVTHSEVRQSAYDVYLDIENGDLAAIAMGKWESYKTAIGYFGARTQIVTAAFPEETAQQRAARGAEFKLISAVEANPEMLRGGGVSKVADRIAKDKVVIVPADVRARPTSAATLKKKLDKGALSSVSVGLLSGCATPENGLCGGITEANHQLCVLGCHNGLLDSYQRARIEWQRRHTLRLLGTKNAVLASKLENHADLLAYEAEMTDDELLDVLTGHWPDKFVGMLRDLVELPA